MLNQFFLDTSGGRSLAYRAIGLARSIGPVAVNTVP